MLRPSRHATAATTRHMSRNVSPPPVATPHPAHTSDDTSAGEGTGAAHQAARTHPVWGSPRPGGPAPDEHQHRTAHLARPSTNSQVHPWGGGAPGTVPPTKAFELGLISRAGRDGGGAFPGEGSAPDNTPAVGTLTSRTRHTRRRDANSCTFRQGVSIGCMAPIGCLAPNRCQAPSSRLVCHSGDHEHHHRGRHTHFGCP